MNKLMGKRVLDMAPVSLIDYIIFAITVVGCFVLFLGFDISALISGIAYLACSVVVYKIAYEMGMGAAKSKLCTYAVITMPIGFYCQFILGKSEAFMLLFILLGFYFWLRDDNRLFILFFAMTFLFGIKAFPVFITLLLLKQKRLEIIAVSTILSLVPAVIKGICTQSLPNFNNLEMTGAVIPLGGSGINVSIITVIVIMIYTYSRTVDSKDDYTKWSLYLVGLQMFAMFGLGGFEVQYLLIMIPFFAFSAFIHKDTKIFMVLDLLLMLFFVLFMVNGFEAQADANLFLNGILGSNIDKIAISEKEMKDVLVFQDKNVIFSFFSVLLLIMAVFKHPSYVEDDFGVEVISGTKGFVRVRFVAGIAIFLLPAFLSYRAAVSAPYITLYTPDIYGDINYVTADSQQAEVFISSKGKLESVSFCIGTYDKANDTDITVRIVDATTEELKFSKDINMINYIDGDWVYVDTEGTSLIPGTVYRIDVLCDKINKDECITIYRTEDLAEQTNGYAFVGGERQDYHLCVMIMEDYLPSEEAK